ncbi:PREDICTED: G-protein coupled receptor Mth2-like [Wasmannia auropunctata]|uniref:G-protein coupled receptor Mth2-like n=1 Tax=Wasmannia auropunctata TaxID=64793 RepID=UPI0005EDC58B|nr:PREDICTED: G-protein coupled receptor Mth2-like [Wasmannia auropunctata]
MCDRSASFNLAVLLAACGLLTARGGADGVGDAANVSLSDDPRCSPSLSVILSSENDTDDASTRPSGNNGSIFYDGINYSPDLRWTDGNVIYGCICRVRTCIRKCCANDEVLRKNSNKKRICQKISQNDRNTSTEAEMLDLRLPKDQMSDELKHIDTLKEHFHLVQDNSCSGRLYALYPDDSGEITNILLQTNGSLLDIDRKEQFPIWNYCIDWKVTVHHIGILGCWTPASESKEPEYIHHHVGIIVSIPFLVATFLVYAITPELRNLYGKTLMCYVICLIIAYVFLILVNYIYMSPIRILCFSTDND